MDERLINAKENGNKVVNFITKNYKTLLMVLFGLFIFYWMVFILTPKVGMSPEDKAKIDSLNVVINNMYKEQELLDDKIDNINKEINEVDNNINKIKKQKTIVKEVYHEKINRVSNFTEPELDSFFSDRYK
jgi:flagellar capping protein FliD